MKPHPAVQIFSLYNEFRKAGGLSEDPTPAINVWVDDQKKEVYVPSEDDDQNPSMIASINEQITIPFEFDVCDDDDTLKAALKDFQEKVLSHPGRHWTSLTSIRDSKGRKRDWQKINEVLNRCLKAYNIGKPYSLIVAELELANTNASEKVLKSADREAKRYFCHAKKLVKASSNGFISFCREAVTPLDRNL